MDKTKIEWCDSTWNPVTGCYHGCEYCYARGITTRFGTFMRIDGNDIKVINPETNTPCVEVAYKTINPYPEKFTPTFHRYRIGEYKNKKSRNIFVCSMADLFGAWIPDEWIKEVFEACVIAPQHNYLFLTKNPERYISLDMSGKLPHGENMWYGMTVSNNEQAEKANIILEDMTEAAGAFLSIEPILEEVAAKLEDAIANFTDWVIIGAETGNRKNKVIPEREWIEKIVVECDKFNVPVFMKESLVSIIGEENMRREFPFKGGSRE